MSKFSKLVLVAAMAAAGLASPAFAQSFDPEVGTGNVLSFSYVPAAASSVVPQKQVAVRHVRHSTIAARQSGLNSFALVSGAQGGSLYDPAATGGGSVGYNNQNLREQGF
jgi:hypothetical protein